jgi:hypothetical protein
MSIFIRSFLNEDPDCWLEFDLNKVVSILLTHFSLSPSFSTFRPI